MQAALHQHAGAAQFDGLANLFVDGVELEDVAFFGGRAFQRTVEGAEGAVLGAEVGVVDVAVDDVGDHAFGMQLAADRVGFHADADQVVGVEQVEGLGFGQGHGCGSILKEDTRLLQIRGTPEGCRDVACYVFLAPFLNGRRHSERCRQDVASNVSTDFISSCTESIEVALLSLQ